MPKQIPFNRAERVAEQIQHLASSAVVTELDDPRLAGVVITRVRVTGDLRLARLYFYVAGDEARREQARHGLLHAAGFFKRLIGDGIDLKFMPEIEVFYDERIDEQERVEKLFDRIKESTDEKS